MVISLAAVHLPVDNDGFGFTLVDDLVLDGGGVIGEAEKKKCAKNCGYYRTN